MHVKPEPRKEFDPQTNKTFGMLPPWLPGGGTPTCHPSQVESQTPSQPTALLPTTATERKAMPIAAGVLDYFPAALVAVAEVSKHGNDQHNPGEPLGWARGKSMDQADCLIRHFLERGTNDSDGLRHSAKMTWRALALLQLELEAAGYPIARGAR